MPRRLKLEGAYIPLLSIIGTRVESTSPRTSPKFLRHHYIRLYEAQRYRATATSSAHTHTPLLVILPYFFPYIPLIPPLGLQCTTSARWWFVCYFILYGLSGHSLCFIPRPYTPRLQAEPQYYTRPMAAMGFPSIRF